MKHPNLTREQTFIKSWKKFSGPLKKEIKDELKHKKPREAVNFVFRKYKVRQKLEKLVMDSVMGAIKDGLR